MKKHVVRVFAVLAAVMFLSITVMELNAHARAGGSRSSGSSGSRSYSRPASPSSQPGQQLAPAPSPLQQPAGGGFMRSMAGGMMGGMLGSMLFSSFAGAGAGAGTGGGGMGMFEIILLAGVGYLIYRYIKKKRADSSSLSSARGSDSQQNALTSVSSDYQTSQLASDAIENGLSHIRQMDASFDENRFNDQVMDIFFRIQGAWMNRNLSPISGLLTGEMTRIFQEDLERMLRDKQINRLENIAVRNVEISEAWQESGQDYITASIYANLLDYTTDDTTGAVVAGSKTEPIKFEECWTFVRPVGNHPWQLSAINQR